MDAGQQLARAERLRQVVVGAELEADHPIHRLAAMAGEHDDRKIGIRSKRANDLETVLIAELQVENHQVDRVRSQHPLHLAAVGSHAHPHALIGQVVRDHGAHGRIVIDDKNVCHAT